LAGAIYYFGFAKKVKGKGAQRLDGKTVKRLLFPKPSCRLAILPFSRFAIHVINKILAGEHRGIRMQQYIADLHIHSVLSPCGDLDMSPSKILKRAKEKGLNLIAITDHNMVENGIPLKYLAEGQSMDILFGMEITTQEEIHVLCLFDELEIALRWQDIVYEKLPDIKCDFEIFGHQLVVNEHEEIVRFEEKLLINATEISIESVFDTVEKMGGLAIPAHLDKPVNSILSQVGLIPPHLPLSAVEVTKNCNRNKLIMEYPELSEIQCVGFSDAHYLEEIGTQTTLFNMDAPTIQELKLALKQYNGRSIEFFPTPLPLGEGPGVKVWTQLQTKAYHCSPGEAIEF